MLEILSETIFFHTEKTNSLDKQESRVFIKKIITTAKKIILMLPIQEISLILQKNSQISKNFADFIVFEGENCEELLPYLEKIDENLVNEYKYAEKCVQGLEAYKTMKQILINESILPIQNYSVFTKAIDFFHKIVSVLEFEEGSRVLNAIIDLNCYSLFIEENSSQDCKKDDCQNIFLGLLCSNLSKVVNSTLEILNDCVNTEALLTGIAAGASRLNLVKKLILEPKVFQVLIIKHSSSKLLCKVLSSPKDYELVLPLFTIVSSIQDENLEGVLHLLTISNPAIQPLKFIRDLFSKNPNRRAISSMILKNSNSPEEIQQEWSALKENI